MKFKVTTITPLHIGNGFKWYPFEYWAKGNNIIIGDFNKFVESILSMPQWEENFKKLCAIFNRIDNNRSNFSFIDLLNEFGLENFKEKLSQNITLSFSTTLCDSSGNFRKEIEQFIKHPDGSLYIPGSSVKGAIKTAILNKLINKQSILELYSQNDKSNLDIKFSYYDEHNISVEDVELNKKVISETEVIKRLGMKVNDQTQRNPSNSKGLSSIEVVNIYDTDEIYITIKSEINFEEIREIINSFHLKAIEESLLITAVKECNVTVNAFMQIKELMESDKKSFFIQLGKCGNYFSKSLGSMIKEYAVENKLDNQYLNKLRNKLRFGKAPRAYRYVDPFPKTFSVSSENKPFGWVKLTLVEE